MLPLDLDLDFDPAREAEFFSLLPPRPAVCLIEPREEKAEPYLIRTADLRRRLERLLGQPDPASKRLNLREFARGVRYRVTGSAFEQTLTYYHHAKEIFPKRYRDMLRMRPPAVLKVSLRNAYPRCYVTRRIPTNESGAPIAGAYYGPFASRRSAEMFAESALDFFKVRRCQIKIRRDPSFPGCIYSEMKMCLAPCFAGCSKEEYDAEVTRLVQFLETSGGSLRAAIESEREQASEALDFERAAALHKRVEKLDGALRGQPELARRIQDLDAVILQRAADEQTVGVYAVKGGRLTEPFFMRFGEMVSQLRSAEEMIRDHLETAGVSPHADLSENLWLLARWFYAHPREGEILYRDKDWPYRRMLRACSRLLQPKEGPGAEPAP
ncbi:MAG TPA: UvrB/UvrC motif-containing protein [Candidatus Acidoferrales bacterium]|nr:UvrB/UvrC motif-containing protein [Candidatus Acidoferrales bacterium]